MADKASVPHTSTGSAVPGTTGSLGEESLFLPNRSLCEFSVVGLKTLAPIAERVFIRLIVESEALKAHVERLKLDGDKHFALDPRTFFDGPRVLAQLGPSGFYHSAFDQNDAVASAFITVLIISDAHQLEQLAAQIASHPSAFWQKQFAVPRPTFVPGDRDDLAAARLYELAKQIPVGR